MTPALTLFVIGAHTGAGTVKRGTASDLLGVAAAAGNREAAAEARRLAIAKAVADAKGGEGG